MTGEGAHMTPAEFRRHGREAVDWIADYLERIEDLPVLSHVEPGDVRRALPPHPPEQGEEFAAVLVDLDRVIVPGLTHWQSPSFFGYFPASSSGPSVLGELVSAGLGVQGMLWSTSPACTELEEHVLDWLLELLGLPERFRSGGSGGGVIQDSASSATLVALVAARERARARGATGRLTAYASTQAHSSVDKAVRIAGLGPDALRLVPVEPASQALDATALRRLVAEDLAAGATPVLLVASVGTTSTTAVDPVRAMASVAAETGAWLHVDAAYAGIAGLLPELRWVHDGVELADSYCTNPHKWMFTNFDCDAFWVADKATLISALSVLPEYLRNAATESGEVTDFRDWQVPLGRRFRALKLWFVLRHYGAVGLRRHVREHIALADRLAGWVEADPDWEIVAPHPLGLVCLRHRAGDEVTRGVLTQVNAGGAAFLTHTVVRGDYAIRVSVAGARTQERHVAALWDLMRQAAARSLS